MQDCIGATHITLWSKKRVINEWYIKSREVTNPNTSGVLTEQSRSILFRLKDTLMVLVVALTSRTAQEQERMKEQCVSIPTLYWMGGNYLKVTGIIYVHLMWWSADLSASHGCWMSHTARERLITHGLRDDCFCPGEISYRIQGIMTT